MLNKSKSVVVDDLLFTATNNFFRELLQIDNNKAKEATTTEIKAYYDKNEFNSNDIYDISKATIKEDELFDYAGVPNYLKNSKKSYKEKDDYEIGM